MTIEEELNLSYYQEIANLNDSRTSKLVQHRKSLKLFVKKILCLYDKRVYEMLKSHPVPNMPKIIEAVEEDGTLIVIEEYLSGDTLQECLEKNGCFSEEETVGYLVQLGRIVHSLHSVSIIHRDIKPSNIILSPDGILKLLDINAAKIISESKSKDTILIGTEGFAAPEQYGFSSSNKQTDIYALGVLMNVMLTGDLPQNRQYKGKYAGVIQRCTKMDWNERYTSVDELCDEICSLRDGRRNHSSSFVQTPSRHPAQNGKRMVEYRKFFPPGFRTNNMAVWLLAGIGYMFLIMASLSITSSDASAIEIYFDRFCVFCSGLCIVLFDANYLGIRSYFPLASSKKIVVRAISIAAIDFLIIVFGVVSSMFFSVVL